MPSDVEPATGNITYTYLNNIATGLILSESLSAGVFVPAYLPVSLST